MTWVLGNLELIWNLTFEHLVFALIPVVLGILLSLPLGWLANRTGIGRTLTINVAGLLYTVPSLALFVILPPLLGTQILDPINVIVALTMGAIEDDALVSSLKCPPQRLTLEPTARSLLR